MPGMPPPQGPQPSGPPQGAPQGGPPGQSANQGQAIQELMKNVEGALNHLEDFIHSAPGASPQEKQLISQIGQMFDALVQGAGGEPDDDGKGQAPPSPMEAGANKGAMPAGPQGPQ